MLEEMERLNDIGESLGRIKGVHAMTDITGFGLLGHTIEMAEGSKLSAELFYSQIQLLPGVADYLKDRVIPDATYRNWNCYNLKTSFASDVDVMQAFSILPDPQTNGGLLIAVDDTSLVEVQELLVQHGLGSHCEPIGRMGEQEEKTVVVKKCQ
jgi:selenide,water dikinase